MIPIKIVFREISLKNKQDYSIKIAFRGNITYMNLFPKSHSHMNFKRLTV